MGWTKKIHVESSMTPKEKHKALFIGRWQPLHEGHKALFRQALDEGKDIVIAVRHILPDEKNPFTPNQIIRQIQMDFIEKERLHGRVTTMIIPDIHSVEFGRGVGYDIIEHIPPVEVGEISATKIREELKKDGKL